MNSSNTTFPRNDDKETFCPVSPLASTTGRVKSGALEFVVIPLGEGGCEKEYTAQTTTIKITAMVIFSPQPIPFLRLFALDRRDMCFALMPTISYRFGSYRI
jgi:hypothetical protein